MGRGVRAWGQGEQAATGLFRDESNRDSGTMSTPKQCVGGIVSFLGERAAEASTCMTISLPHSSGASQIAV
jgi:hypothetical protein